MLLKTDHLKKLYILNAIGTKVKYAFIISLGIMPKSDLDFLINHELIELEDNKQGTWIYLTMKGKGLIKPVVNLIDSLDRLLEIKS